MLESAITVSPRQLTGDEPLTLYGRPNGGLCVSAFWRWAASNLVDNVTRGLLAEFIVASALGVGNGVRSAWDAFDLITPDGVRVEVKSAAYIQAWPQRRPSPIRFKVGPRIGWDSAAGTYGRSAEWQADVYVFAVLQHMDRKTLDPLDLGQWAFYIVSTGTLKRLCPRAKSVSLRFLTSIGATAIPFDGLPGAVASAASS